MSRYVQAYIRRPNGNEVVFTICNRFSYNVFKKNLKRILLDHYDMSVRVDFVACSAIEFWCGKFVAQYRLAETPTSYRLVRSIIERSTIPSSSKNLICVFDVFKYLNTL